MFYFDRSLQQIENIYEKRRKENVQTGKLLIRDHGMSTVSFAGEVAEACKAEIAAENATFPDPEGQCACFEVEATGDLAKEYLDMDKSADWFTTASPGLLAAGDKCFPEAAE